MNFLKNLDGAAWKRIHLCLIFFFIALWITAAFAGWLASVVFVSHVSMVALVLAEISSWQGSRTEQKQDQQMADQEDDIDDLEHAHSD